MKDDNKDTILRRDKYFKWFKTKYSPDQETEIQNLLDNEVWITARREHIPVPEMTTNTLIMPLDALMERVR